MGKYLILGNEVRIDDARMAVQEPKIASNCPTITPCPESQPPTNVIFILLDDRVSDPFDLTSKTLNLSTLDT